MADLVRSAKKMVETLNRDVIDDPEDLWVWLDTDGLEILEDWLERQEAPQPEADKYPPGYGTHWHECWREHHGCCVKRVEQLEAELAECRALLDLHPSGDDCIHCGERPATQRGYPFCTVCYYELREQASADEYDDLSERWAECQEKLAAAV